MSDLVFYLFADALDLALKNIENMSSTQREEFQKPVYDLPNPDVGWGHWYSTKRQPYCLTATAPAYGKSSIKVVGDVPMWFGNLEAKIPTSERNIPGCQHLDRCGSWVPHGGATFAIPKLEKGILMFCGQIDGSFKVKIGNYSEAFLKRGFFQRKCSQVEKLPSIVFEQDFEINIISDRGRIDHVIAA